MLYARCRPPVGGTKQSLPALTDHCPQSGRNTHPEDAYTPVGPCHRRGAVEK